MSLFSKRVIVIAIFLSLLAPETKINALVYHPDNGQSLHQSHNQLIDCENLANSVAAGASLGEAIAQLRIPYPRRRSLNEYMPSNYEPGVTVENLRSYARVGVAWVAYQLGKIVYGVLNLTVNAVINPEAAQKTWDGYIEPISSLIDALKNKQISLRDGIRAGTALAVSMKAQSMLAKGCETLYSVAKTRALTYLAKNPLVHPKQYMEMGDNFAFKLANDPKIEWAKHYRKHIPPKGVDWKTVVKETTHGPARYKHGLDIENFELMAWKKGIPVTNGKTWKVMKADSIIGAVSGAETPYVRIEMSANTIHGHPITLEEYRSLLK